MDYLSLLQQPFLQVKQNPATKSMGMGPLDDYWYEPVRTRTRLKRWTLFRRAVAVSRRGHAPNAVAAMPFAIMRGKNRCDQRGLSNKVGWLPDPLAAAVPDRGIADRVLACVLVERAQPRQGNRGALRPA